MYTENDIHDIVEFATKRHIMVVPEIELPGHSSALLAAYPQFGCTGGPYEVEDRYGVFDDVLCAGNDDIFKLSGSIFDSLASLFPAPYIHFGGDEVTYIRWNDCPKCRAKMIELGVKEAKLLQGYLTNTFAKQIKDRGKIPIGWDEVIDDNKTFPLDDEVIVMSWRGSDGGESAARKGHKVIMAPFDQGCYLDYKPRDAAEDAGNIGLGTPHTCWNMSPRSPAMNDAEAALVLGGQGNLWTELIPADRLAEYMIFPRLCALSEALWTAPENKDWQFFTERMTIHRRRLAEMDILQYTGPLG
jgi:hexosaminidase